MGVIVPSVAVTQLVEQQSSNCGLDSSLCRLHATLLAAIASVDRGKACVVKSFEWSTRLEM